jgi:hypothetical protein
MLEENHNFNMISLLNTFIMCEKNHNKTVINEINKKCLNSIALCHLFIGRYNK